MAREVVARVEGTCFGPGQLRFDPSTIYGKYKELLKLNVKKTFNYQMKPKALTDIYLTKDCW